MIDRVIDLKHKERIVAIKNVSINEPFFNGHFPGLPIMPGVLIVEAIAQAGGALLLTEVEDRNDKVMVFILSFFSILSTTSMPEITPPKTVY